MRPDVPDAPTDAHLLAALRHAPDRGVAPPPGLSARILAQAQQAVAPAPAAPWLQRLRQGLRALSRLLSQPALTGALATVALATVIGVMWRSGAPVDSEPGLTEATRPAFEPAASAPAVSERRREVEVAEVAAAPPQVLAAASPVARAKPPARAQGETPGRPKVPHPAGHVDDSRRRLAGAAETPAAAAPQAPTAPVTAAAVAKPAPADDLAREVESAQANRARTAERMEITGTSPRPLAAVLDALREQPADVQVVPVPPRSAQAPTPSDAQADKLSEGLRRRLATDGSLAAKASAPPTEPATADRQWLARVAHAAQGRWEPVATPTDHVRGGGHTVQIGGTDVGRLVLTDGGVLWVPVTGPAWHADLSPATLQALRAQAPRR